ncbi:MAG TPA: methyltransferase domain-containing protein [Verrucomicrobiota bacterium]|nr:hypothetical protein [Verrucomicrobiales bacterium]HRI14112.1 methyltransferase domain-containing protein [Verrucomicrobiota bacterium]
MFLRHRATQAEYFDDPARTPEELGEHYAALERVNRLIHFDRPFRVWLPRLLGEATCRYLTLLDLGAGDGQLDRQLSQWAGTRGWNWEFTNFDLCPHAAPRDPNPRHVIGSVTQLPFADQSFDAVLASTMAHHLRDDGEVIAHFREAARVARRVVLLCDMHRNPLFLGALWTLLQFTGESVAFRADGILSVRRGWRVGEWRRFAEAAGLSNARLWQEHGTRVLLAWCRPSDT